MKTLFLPVLLAGFLAFFGAGRSDAGQPAFAGQPDTQIGRAVAQNVQGAQVDAVAVGAVAVDVIAQVAAPDVSVTLVSETTAIEPGKPFRIGAEITLPEGWHVYYREPGDTGMPTSVDLKLPDGYQVVKVEWEQPSRFEENGFTTFGYSGKTVIAVTVLPPANLKAGENVEISAAVSWLACKDSCIPGDTTRSITLPVASSANPAVASNQSHFAKVGFTGDVKQIGKPGASSGTSVLDGNLKPNGAGSEEHGFFVYLLFAFIGGMILNFMPCVLPVISFKIFRFVKEAGESKARIFQLGLAYAAGTVFTCVALAAAVILAKFLGYSVGWGFQFQEPLFLVGMATLLTVMSLGFFGVFFIQVQSGKGLDQLASKQGFSGAFFTGVVATLLSTPCTAPFLGSAIGFAFSQPWWVILSIFFAVGAGLAAPYVVLCANPAWLKKLPKPGAWMEYFKEGMGFVLLGSVIWLLFVLGRQVGADGVAATVAFLVAASFATWLYNRLGGIEASRLRKGVLAVVGIAIAGATMYMFTWPAVKGVNAITASTAAQQQANGVTWEPFSKAAVDQNLSQGKVVIIDFTAEWCQTCKLNEATVLSSDAVADSFKKNGVVALKADWTHGDAEITALLAKFGRAGVPLYVIMSPHRPTQPIVLPTLLTKQMVIDAIEEAAKP